MIIGEDITKYIPHRAPFVMVDKMLAASAELMESEFLVRAENILIRDGFFPESGLMENIAQTCAAGFGLLDSEQGEGPKNGYIGAISKVEVYELPPVGALIQTSVTPLHQLGNIFLVKGLNSMEGRKLLECEMKIVVG